MSIEYQLAYGEKPDMHCIQCGRDTPLEDSSITYWENPDKTWSVGYICKPCLRDTNHRGDIEWKKYGPKHK